MSKASEFRLYAIEAMREAHKSKTEKEKLMLTELARTWTQAALLSEGMVMVKYDPPEHRAM